MAAQVVDRNACIAAMVEMVPSLSVPAAITLLEANGWQVEAAIATFFGDPIPAPAPPPPTSPAAGPRAVPCSHCSILPPNHVGCTVCSDKKFIAVKFVAVPPAANDVANVDDYDYDHWSSDEDELREGDELDDRNGLFDAALAPEDDHRHHQQQPLPLPIMITKKKE